MIAKEKTKKVELGSFQQAWNVLGRDNATRTLTTLGKIFYRWTVDPNKQELMNALNFISGDAINECNKGETSARVRGMHMSRTYHDEHEIICTNCDNDKDEEEVEQQLFVHIDNEKTHMLEIIVSEIKMQSVFKGYFKQFLAIERLWNCIRVIIHSIDVSNETVKQKCFHEFEDILSTFFFIEIEKVNVLNDNASNCSCDCGLPRLVDLQLPLNLDAFKRNNYDSIAKHLKWIHHFQFEIVNNKNDKNHVDSNKRVFSLAWEKPLSSIIIQFTKVGDSFLWHNNEDMIESMQVFLKKNDYVEDTFHYANQDVIYFRISMSLNLFWNVSSPTTTLYLSAKREDCENGTGRSMIIKLIKIAGFSGWVTSLFVDNLSESVDLLLKFSVEEDEHPNEKNDGEENFPIFNTFSWHLRGTAPPSSVLLWIVHTLWHKLVMSAFLYEVLHLWSTIFCSLGQHISVELPKDEHSKFDEKPNRI